MDSLTTCGVTFRRLQRATGCGGVLLATHAGTGVDDVVVVVVVKSIAGAVGFNIKAAGTGGAIKIGAAV